MSKSLKVVELFAGSQVDFGSDWRDGSGMSPRSGYTKPLSRAGTVYADCLEQSVG